MKVGEILFWEKNSKNSKNFFICNFKVTFILIVKKKENDASVSFIK